MNAYRFLLPLLMLLVFWAVPSDSKTVYVTPGGAGSLDGSNWANACQSIAAGLTASASGDEVWVNAAWYNEAITMKQGVALYGGFAGTEAARAERNWTANETIIDATGQNKSAVVGRNYATLDGFTVTGANTSLGGVYCSAASPKLTNCTITGNTVSSGGGMYCTSSSPTLTNCAITGNSASWNGGGMYCDNNSSPTLTNCAITDNSAGAIGGGVICSSSSPKLTNCTITRNKVTGRVMNTPNYNSGGVHCFGHSSPTLTNCILWNTGAEVSMDATSVPVVTYSCVQAGWPGEGNIAGDPLFADVEAGDYRLLNGSACVDRALLSAAPIQDINGNLRPGGDGKVDMGAYESPDEYEPGPSQHTPRALYVRAGSSAGGDGLSWETAFSSISAALNVSGASDEIRVSSGRYAESLQLEPGVSLYGGFPSGLGEYRKRPSVSNETIIDATGQNRSAVYAVDDVILDGFTITGGVATVGGGVYCYNVSPTLTNCTITGNVAKDGGGVYCENNSSPTLTNCAITGNSASWNGGGMYCDNNSSPALTNCVISGNDAGDDGGGVYCKNNSSLTLASCTITGNTSDSGGGVYCYSSSPVLTSCAITENTALTNTGNGGGICAEYLSSLTLTDCTIAGNASYDGGGVYNTLCSMTLMNSTITKNTATRGIGGGLHNYVSSVSLTDCAISENVAQFRAGGIYSDGFYTDTTSLSLTNCAVTGNVGVEGVGLYCTSGILLTMTNCTISGNGPSESSEGVCVGGGLYCDLFTSPTLTNCTIAANRSGFGGGMYCELWTSPTLTHCTITGNSAVYEGGGLELAGGSPSLTACVISGNSSRDGGGMVCGGNPALNLSNCAVFGNTASRNGGGLFLGSPATLTNWTIAGNTSSAGGSGIYCTNTNPTLKNCILWNPGAEITKVASNPIVTYSCVEGGYAGVGNISTNPQFVYSWDGQWGDLHLLSNSPCINAAIVASVTDDLDGQPRPYGAGYDIGAYEYNPNYSTPTDTPTTETPSFTPTNTPTDTPASETQPITPTFTETDTPTPTPTSIPGDINHDGDVDEEDMLLLFNTFGQNTGDGDLNGDGTVDSRDLFYLASRWRVVP